MPGKGNEVVLDLSSVKDSAKKTIKFLNTKLSAIHPQKWAVVFLGEQHGNEIDQQVTRAMLTNPPLSKPGMRVIFERGLDGRYVAGDAFASEKTEPTDFGQNRQARSKKLAEMVMDAFSNGIEMVYVVCGSAHGEEIFEDLNKRWTENFTYILKPSVTD
jgi:hypothetical protein